MADVRLLTEKQLADLLETSPRGIQGWRLRGVGPPFVKLGSSRRAPVRYDLADVLAWIEKQKRQFTSEVVAP